MALTAGEYISGGEVRDADGRTVVIVEGGAGGAVIASGTAAARPAAGTANRLYWATDTNEITFDDGAAWHTVGQTSAATLNVGGTIHSTAGTLTLGDLGFGSAIQTNNGKVSVAGVLDASTNAAGNGLQVKEGANAKQGTATLTAGAVTVANTSVTATSRIFLTSNADGGTPGFLRVSARVAGTSFTITSSSGTDTSTVAFQIFEPG